MPQSNAKKKPLSSLPTSPNTSKQSDKDTFSTLSERQSQELIIGLCGLIGTGMHSVRKCLEYQLESQGYEIVHIHISSLLKRYFSPDESALRGYERYIRYQALGNEARKKFGSQILAEAAISEIAHHQKKHSLNQNQENNDEKKLDWKFKGKVAYIIDQLKNPYEVELLRLVYQHNFYYIGVIRSENERKRNLRDEGITNKEADELIHLDRKSNGDVGQQTEKAILDADFYLRNNQSHYHDLKEKIKRFVDLIHGVNGITPTVHEKGMFSAFSASLQSACLSRQVGAAIMDEYGNIIATGRNDVPKFGGGLYSYEDNSKDFRCVHKGGKCYNEAHKKKIKEQIEDVINKNKELQKLTNPDSCHLPSKVKELLQSEKSIEAKTLIDLIEDSVISDSFITDLVNEIYDNTRLGSLIEFSRSIHAEMDAITSLARLDGANTRNKSLYSTTYPCHNCARHIVAAGIKEVIYIEPYEKSLALDLHDDVIVDSNENINGKVVFVTFEGIAPRRYQKFFYAHSDRKVDGFAVPKAAKYDNHVDVQFIDSAQTFQVKIFETFQEKMRAN